MRLKLITCKSMSRELSYLSALSTNSVDITWIRQGFHDTPDLLHSTLQAEVDAVESGHDPHTNALVGTEPNPRTGVPGDFDAILIGYGLCSNGVVGLHSTRLPLVIPRGHDCITMLLGSRERYRAYFSQMPDCFWYTASWIENCTMPCAAADEQEKAYYREQGYDEDELEYLMDMMHGWTRNYHHAAYIRMPFFDNPEHQAFTREAADHYGWHYDLIDGDVSLLKKFIEGDWDEDTFLTVPPGYEVYATGDDRIIDCRKIEETPAQA